MLNQIFDILRTFPQSAALCKSGTVYYISYRGELSFATTGNTFSATSSRLVDVTDDAVLSAVLAELQDSPTAAIDTVIEKVKAKFNVTHETPVEVMGDNDHEGNTPIIGRVLCGEDKETGTTLCILSGFAGGSVCVLTPVADAGGNVSPHFVRDLEAFSFAIMEMADKLSREFLNKPVIPDFDNDETTDNTVFPKQRRAEA